MASWTEDIWSQDDDVNFGLPYVTATGYAQVPNFNNLTFYWKFEDATYKMPIPKSCQMILAVDYTNVATIFGNNEKNYGLPMPITCNQFPVSGAFKGCTNLVNVQIPLSVTFIDYYSFNDTSVSSVTISPDCRFYKNTFPQGCQINYYTASIDRIEWNGSPVTELDYVVNSSDISELTDENCDIIISITDGIHTVERKLKNFTVSGVDTSQLDTGLTGTIIFNACDGTPIDTYNFTYNVVQSASLTMLGSGNDDPENNEETTP
jgi:hypothetical protein